MINIYMIFLNDRQHMYSTKEEEEKKRQQISELCENLF